MIYQERDQLTIIELQEERKALSYEELFRALTERPNSVVYIEWKGLLYGIITLGRIARAHQSHLRQVDINTKFTWIGPHEHMKAREIFQQERDGTERSKKISVLPVVDSDGKLLGQYTLGDDLLSIEYSLSFLKKLNSIEFIKYSFVLVKPGNSTPTEQRLASKLVETLKQKGFVIKVIDFHQILEYPGAADCILFCDGAACRAAKLLCECLQDRPGKQAVLLSYLEFIDILQDRTRQLLLELQAEGVHVAAVGFEETDSGYLRKLEVEIDQRRKQNGLPVSARLYPEMREEFLSDLCERFAGQGMPAFSFHMRDGVIQPRDISSPLLNVEHGRRRTTGQPETCERSVYLYGACPFVGLYTDDQHTIASLLQEKINLAGLKCKVFDCSCTRANADGRTASFLTRVLSTSLREGDIVIFDLDTLKLEGIQKLNLVTALERCQAPSNWFINNAQHCNHKANQIYAEAIYEALLPALHQPAENRRIIQKGGSPVQYLYLDRYFDGFDASAYKTVGSIVMNCNPFTFGHRYLIEEALKQVEFLMIFVVQEDSSLFSFQERLAMVYAGTAGLKNVMVVPCGHFILSRMTFPEYFIKETDEEILENTENDVRLFAEQIAPPLGITHRFVGEEPEDEVTSIYNQAMKRVLPAHGIQLVEIPRKQDGQGAISATRVRRCLKENDFEGLDTLVPTSTKNILFYTNK